MREWMTEFDTYLTTTYPAAVETDGTADALRAAICENLQLYMEKNEEEFKDYLSGFATAVWGLLMSPAAASPSRDQLTITAIKFLTTISTSVHHALFGGTEVLQQICNSIVLPNVRFSDENEELFEMNYTEYIRRDMEGSDVDTRRRTACELLKGIASNYKEQVMSLVTMGIQNMLAVHAANPGENWKEKDCAIYLVVALSNKTGGSIIDVQSFFTSVIVPELQGQDVNSTPVLKAGALKFFTVFREQIPKQIAVTLLPDVVRFLAAESNVVHSYAANCIEKLLLVKDSAPGLNAAVSSHPRYGATDINPYLPSLLNNLFNALKLPESQENPYVMKCIMRVLGIADVDREVAKFCIGSLALLLDEARKNPRNPLFNHYLFEAIAALTGRSCEREPALIGVFETNLFPVLQSILVEDVADFWPYTFQIFAQLVDVSSPPLSEHYMQLFEVLLSEATWKRPGNAPALVRLLQAYLQKVPSELNNQGNLIKVLDRFGSLVSKSHTEDLGFYVLNTVVENLNYDIIAPFIGRIWAALFERLKVQQNRSVKYVNSVVIFMSLVLVKHGISILVDSINTLHPNNPNLFGNILQQFWIPNVRLISGPIELKLAVVASTRLLCESMVLLDPLAAELWGRMLDSITSLLSRPDNGGVELEADSPDIPDNMGYSASFARLHHAGRKQEDPLKNISSPKEFLITSLARLSATTPGRYPAIIENFVDPANRAFLLQLCGAYNCTIV